MTHDHVMFSFNLRFCARSAWLFSFKMGMDDTELEAELIERRADLRTANSHYLTRTIVSILKSPQGQSRYNLCSQMNAMRSSKPQDF